jgi:hypothetical protein
MNGLSVHYLTYVGYGKTLQILGGLSTDYYDYLGIGLDTNTATTQALGLEQELDRAAATITFDTTNRHGIWTSAFTGFAADYTIMETGAFDQDETNADAVMCYHQYSTVGAGLQAVTTADTLNVVTEIGFDTDTSEQIPNAGLLEAAKLLCHYDSPVAFTYVAYGTGTTAFATSQTALVTQVERKVADKIELASTEVYNDTLRYTVAFTATTAEKVIGEVGIFNAATSGDMLMRKVISPTVTVPSGKIPVVVIDLKISDSANTPS